MNSAVLGMGVVSALGDNLTETSGNLYTDNPRLPERARHIQTALDLPVFEVENLPPKKNQPGGYTVQLLMKALEEALTYAGLSPKELGRQRVGVVIGTTVAAQLNCIAFYESLRSGEVSSEKPYGLDPLKRYLVGNPSEYIQHLYGLKGPAVTISNACTSGADAIGLAHLWLNSDLCDLVIAGGADEINKVPLCGFNAIGVCSPTPCRPFDANRTGLNLGEAAGVMILGKPTAYASFEIAGFGKTSDAFHITQPEPEGTQLEAAIRQAIAGTNELAPKDIAFINAHGTGTQANDNVEMKVFHRIFDQVPFMSTKGMTGHTLGAAGAIEAIFTTLMLKHARAAKSTRFQTAPPDAPCIPLTQHLNLSNPEFALSTSLAFGGSNTALLIRRLH